jgi:hypothetical protein
MVLPEAEEFDVQIDMNGTFVLTFSVRQDLVDSR